MHHPDIKFRRRPLMFLLLCFFCIANLQTHAATSNLSASKDNTLFNSESSGDINSNGLGTLFAGLTGGMGPGAQRAVIAFDIAAEIPAGSVITDVQLTLDILRGGNGSGIDTYSLHRLEQDWGEGTSNATGGAGVAATTGDATWIHTFFDTDSWTNPGGDFSNSPSASEEIGVFGPASWGSTDELVADVQSWLDNPSNNFGWILIGNESASASSRQFASRESSAGAPMLSITYTVPEPASLLLGLMSIAAMTTFRRGTTV